MNGVRCITNLVVAVLVSLQLIGFLFGIYYPSKGLIVLAMFVLIGTFLKWSVESLDRKVQQQSKTTKIGGCR